jgi:hypothetical protein
MPEDDYNPEMVKLDDCGNAGFPSEDKRTRRYTDSQCNNLGGIIFPNGYCHRIGGGSFSTDCAYLNNDPLDFIYRQPPEVLLGVGVGVVGLVGYMWWNKSRR